MIFLLPPRRRFQSSLTRHFSSKLRDGLRKERVFTLPNTISMSRFLVSPFMAYSIIQGNFEHALGALFYCGATDFVCIHWLISFLIHYGQIDGYIARKWNSRSALGSVLDPAADKLMVGSLVGSLTYVGLLPCKPILLALFFITPKCLCRRLFSGGISVCCCRASSSATTPCLPQ